MIDFWYEKSLQEMTDKEWESLCDGCGRRCLIKIREHDESPVHYTNVSCKLLNIDTCRCSSYQNRHDFVPECLELREEFDWLVHIMPVTCAYRLLHEGKDLYDWHYLISGDRNSVHEAGISVKGKVTTCTGEEYLPQHIIDWIDYGERSDKSTSTD